MDALSALSSLFKARPLLLTLAIRFIVVASLPILAIALLFRLYYEPLLLNEIDTRQGVAADNIARQLDRHFAIADRELGSLASLFDSSADLSEAQIQTLLDAYADTSDFYEAIYLSDAQGRIRAIGMPADKRGLRQNLYGLDVSARDFVLKAQTEQTGAWSNSFLSTVSSRLAVALAKPLGQRTLIGEVAISPLPELARQLSQDATLQVLIVDRQRQLIASSQYREVSQQLNLGHLPVFQGTSLRVQHLQIDNQDMVGLARTVSGPDWQVLIVQPSEQAYALLSSIWQRLVLSLAAALAVAMGIAALTSWSLVNKISLFSRQVRQIANGSYDLPMQSTSIRELNTLSASLKRMVGAIREREEALLATAHSLRVSEDRLLATLENTPNVAIQWFDAEGRIVLWNHASETLYGIGRDQAMGQTLDQLLFNAEQQRLFMAMLKETATGTGIGPYLDEVRLPDKRQLFILGTLFALPSSEGQQIFVGMGIDVTDQKKAEIAYLELNASLEQRVGERTEALSQSNTELNQAMFSLQRAQKELVQSEKLAALGSLVAGIAHELNTPVGNSLMAASTLEDHSRSIAAAITSGALKRSMLEQFIDDNKTATDILVRNLRKASELITSFKQVAVDQASAQRRHFQLSEVVKEILITLGPTLKRTPFIIDSNIDDSISLDSYPGALGQVLVNLINNALIHGLQGLAYGKIGLYAFPYEPGWIELVLSDNGHGIAEESLPRIFDPFFTSRLGQGGSGLGLNIVHNLVTGVLGGKLEVTSQPGSGARFAIRLPICAPSGEAQTLSAEPSTSNVPSPPAPASDSG